MAEPSDGKPSPGSSGRAYSDRPGLSIAPAAYSTEMIELGRTLPKSVHLGTSSWGFPGWQGTVWRDSQTPSRLSRDGLTAYGEFPIFRTVGIDKTFYRPAPATEFARMAAQVPRGFRFLTKAHEAITRRDFDKGPSRWLDAKYATDEVIEPCMQGLRDKAGPIVFQFSPMGLRRDKDADAFIDDLDSFLAKLPSGPLYAVEVRDRRVLRGAFVHALRSHCVAHCFNVHPAMPSIADQARLVDPTVGPALIVRWMLHSGLTYDNAVDRYSPFDKLVDADEPSRSQVVELLRAALGCHQDSWVIVNNKAEGSAPLSLIAIARQLAAQKEIHEPT